MAPALELRETAGGDAMDMSQVRQCSMESCAYNANRVCHTLAITVGAHAECNTYVHGSISGGFKEAMGGVGSCLAAECKFNERLECQAPDIEVSSHGIHADCETFEKK